MISFGIRYFYVKIVLIYSKISKKTSQLKKKID